VLDIIALSIDYWQSIGPVDRSSVSGVRMNRVRFLFPFLFLTVSGCGSSSDTSKISPATELNETWVSNTCSEYFRADRTMYGSVTIVVAGDLLHQNINFFTDSDCSIPVSVEDASTAIPTFLLDPAGFPLVNEEPIFSSPIVSSQDTFIYSLEFPEGGVITDLGMAHFIDKTLESYTINGVTFDEESYSPELDIYLVVEDRLYFGEYESQIDVRSRTLDIEQTYLRQ